MTAVCALILVKLTKADQAVGGPKLSDLDRCEHGRHSIDPCLSCPDGWSTGNLFLQPGQRIGTTLYGEPIVAEPRRPKRVSG